MTTNVLITGAAGNLAHFIWRALQRCELDVRVIGCNYDHNAVGLFQFDSGYVVPPVSDRDYLPAITNLCREEMIHIIMAGNMEEMRVLGQHADDIRQQTGAFVVASPPHALHTMEDKWELAMFLKRSGFDYPRSVLPSQPDSLAQFLDEVPYPYIIKGRFGAGSQNIGVAH